MRLLFAASEFAQTASKAKCSLAAWCTALLVQGRSVNSALIEESNLTTKCKKAFCRQWRLVRFASRSPAIFNSFRSLHKRVHCCAASDTSCIFRRSILRSSARVCRRYFMQTLCRFFHQNMASSIRAIFRCFKCLARILLSRSLVQVHELHRAQINAIGAKHHRS